MPASRFRTFLELSIDGAERAASIIRRHSCAWQAVSDSQAKSSGSSSRPSGVINRSPRKEKPAQGPVKSIRWCGSNSIMPRSHPCRGSEKAGKSRARGPAIATRRRRTPQQPDRAFRIMYIMLPRGLPIRTPTSPVLAARCSPSSNRPNARRTWLHGANFSPSMQARRCRLDAPLKDGFGDAPG